MTKPLHDFSVFVVGQPTNAPTPAPTAPATPCPKEVLSLGQVDALRIPDDLAYAGALRTLQHLARGVAIGIKLQTFHSELPIELHNHVDTLTYRFFVEDGRQLLAFWVSTHFFGNYAEVDYDGEVLRSWSDGIPATDPAQLRARSQRIDFTLGIRMR